MRFGLVGAGGIGKLRARALEKTSGCRLTAVADVDRVRAIEVAGSAAIFEDYRDLLDSDQVDAVIVSTQPNLHHEVVIRSLAAGKHVLCEKPLSTDPGSCKEMVDAAREADRVLATGFNIRFYPAIQFVKRALMSGAIGELDHIRAFAGHTGLSEFGAPWMYDRKVVGGGTLMDNGIHMIDLTRYLLGEVEEVYGIATGNVWKIDGSEDNGFAMLRSPQGKVATLHTTWSEWKGYGFHIEAYGDRGMVRARYGPMMNTLIRMDKLGGRRKRSLKLYPLGSIMEKLRGWQWTVVKSFQQELAHFMRLADGQPSDIADGFAGLRAVEIAHAVYQSTRERRSIALGAPL